MDNMSGSGKNWFKDQKDDTVVEKTEVKSKKKKAKLPDIAKLDSFIKEAQEYYNATSDKHIGDMLVMIETSKKNFDTHVDRLKQFKLN